MNPTRKQWLGGALVVGAAAVVTYAVIEARQAAHLRPGYPIPEPIPLPPGGFGGGPQGGGQGADPCDLGPSYPEFVWDGVDCVPSDATSPGIYIVDDCSDFIFVAGDDGPQPYDLGERIAAATAASLVPEAKSADPTEVVTAFLDTFWADCPWPPVPDAPERIVQLFMALSVLVGRMIVEDGGRVLGTSDPALVDEQIGQRFAELGYTDFRPELVPEIKLPEIPDDGLPDSGVDYNDDPGAPGPGPDIDVPPPGPGLIDLPGGGGVTPPSQQPGNQDEPLPVCAQIATIASRTINLPAAAWFERKVVDVEILKAPSAECDEYDVVFGMCVGGDALTMGDLDDYVDGSVPADAGEVFFKIRNASGAGVDWASFGPPLWWKHQYKVKIRYQNGKVILAQPGTPPQTVSVAEMDACPAKTDRWPTPTPDVFRVEDESLKERIWEPAPRVKRFRAEGNRLIAEVEYSGLPVFRRDGNESRARLDRFTVYVVNLKVWSAGASVS